jgi:hypothetical protein
MFGNLTTRSLLYIHFHVMKWQKARDFQIDVYLFVYFLVFSVCEGSLSLSILVSIIRSHGNDYFQSYSVLQC